MVVTFSQKGEMSFRFNIFWENVLYPKAYFYFGFNSQQGAYSGIYVFPFRPFEQSPDRLLVTNQAAKFHQKLSTNAYWPSDPLTYLIRVNEWGQTKTGFFCNEAIKTDGSWRSTILCSNRHQ